jgi:glycosyltransferase involved in cell wall biosynthesis
MKLSIIIPLYNEENFILEVLAKVMSVHFPEFVSTYEIIVVDDCSQDNSYQKVSYFIKKNSYIKLLHHEVNKGKGAAVRTGIQAARGDVFFVQDADLELTPLDIPLMLQAMHDLKVEFVNGSRYLAGIDRPGYSYVRYFFNKLFTRLTAFLTRSKITDMACGYKLFHRNLYEKIILHEDRFCFETELIVKALRVQKNNMAEVPVHYFPRTKKHGKKLKTSDGLIMFWAIIKYGLLRLN